MGKTIIVSNRLPISVENTHDRLEFRPSAGGLATGLGCIFSAGENIWIGWPGKPVDDPEEQSQIRHQLEDRKMFPVFLDQQDIADFYEGFSNGVLWPSFHYFPQFIS